MGSKITKVTSFEGVAETAGALTLYFRTFKNTGKYNIQSQDLSLVLV
jgi:hypothetical protein